METRWRYYFLAKIFVKIKKLRGYPLKIEKYANFKNGFKSANFLYSDIRPYQRVVCNIDVGDVDVCNVDVGAWNIDVCDVDISNSA